MFGESKSYTSLFFCAVVHIGISISSLMFGKIEGGEFFFSIPEYLVGAGYIISLFLAAHDDYWDNSIKHTLTVIICTVVLKIVMAFLAQIGLWLIITIILLVILLFAFGGTNSAIFYIITSHFGVWGTIIGIIFAVLAVISADFVW